MYNLRATGLRYGLYHFEFSIHPFPGADRHSWVGPGATLMLRIFIN